MGNGRRIGIPACILLYIYQSFYSLMLDLANKKIILASASPRRKEIMAGLDIPFEVRVKETDESYPDTIDNEKVAIYLAKKNRIRISKT